MAEHEQAVAAWAEGRSIDAVVWTALAPRFSERTGQPFSVAGALRYLRDDLSPPARERAFEYIQSAPSFVDTPLRKAVQQEDWFVALAGRAGR